MQCSLVDDLPDQQRLVRLLPAERESAKPDGLLRSQLALHANAVPGGGREHGSPPVRLLAFLQADLHREALAHIPQED